MISQHIINPIRIAIINHISPGKYQLKRTINNHVIRKLLGEDEDPFTNIATTLAKQSELMTQLKTHENLFNAANKFIPGTGGATKNTMFFNSRTEAM